MIDRILIATDLSERSARAEIRAAMLCKELGVRTGELCMVKEEGLPHSLATMMNIAEPAAKLLITDQTLRELNTRCDQIEKDYGVRWSPNVSFGHPAQELARRAEEMDAEVIVLGAHGRNFLSSMFIGNTADKLVRLAKRPVLIVKNEAVQAYRKVLLPVDYSDDSRIAARLALKLAPAAECTFLNVFHVPFEGHMRYADVAGPTIEEYRDKARDLARQQLDQFLTGLGVDGRHPARAIVHGSPRHAVLDCADKSKPDLIAMGKHGRSRFEELLVGSITRDILAQSPSDILIGSAIKSSVGVRAR